MRLRRSFIAGYANVRKPLTMTRKSIPSKTKEEILKEYNHLCAMCGNPNPHIHHIDEYSNNNDIENLIPLCPNHHLIDQHNPTQKIDKRKIGLFRKYKDPTILRNNFHPLFKRLLFLVELSDSSDADFVGSQAAELTDFLEALIMGEYYSKKVNSFIKKPKISLTEVMANKKESQDAEYLKSVIENKEIVLELVMEQIRYQSWK